jgi:hypothetical protein
MSSKTEDTGFVVLEAVDRLCALQLRVKMLEAVCPFGPRLLDPRVAERVTRIQRAARAMLLRTRRRRAHGALVTWRARALRVASLRARTRDCLVTWRADARAERDLAQTLAHCSAVRIQRAYLATWTRAKVCALLRRHHADAAKLAHLRHKLRKSKKTQQRRKSAQTQYDVDE